MRLVALQVVLATAARKRAGIRVTTRNHGRAPDPMTLALADWLVVLTTVPPEQASPA